MRGTIRSATLVALQLAAGATALALADEDAHTDSVSHTHSPLPPPPQPQPTEKPPWKKLRKERREGAMTHYAYIVCGVVLLAFALRLLGRARASHVRRRVVRSRRGSGSREHLVPGHFASPESSGNYSLKRVLRAKKAALSNIAFVQVIPLSIYLRGTAVEWLFTLGYASTTLALGAYASYFGGVYDYANPMGMVAVAQLVVIVGLAGRNNVLSALTGVSYEKLSYLHRAAGRTCVGCTALHIVGWLIKGLGKHGPWSWRFNTGLLAAIGLGIMFLTSFQRVRNAMWEAFLLVHITMGITFIVATYFHTPEYRHWVWPALVLWGLDRFVGLVRLVTLNARVLCSRSAYSYSAIPADTHEYSSNASCAEDGGLYDDPSAAKVELVSPEVMRVTLHRPTLTWSPGSHMYLSIPGVSALCTEQHPFTIANRPQEDGDVVFIVRAHAGFTHRLLSRIPGTGEAQYFRALVEGPYGTPPRLDHYDTVLLVAGGTGAAYTLAHLLALVRGAQDGTSAVSAVRFVWNVRDITHVKAIAPQLNAALLEDCRRGGGSNLAIRIEIHVTRSAASDEPGPEAPWTCAREAEFGRRTLVDAHPDGYGAAASDGGQGDTGDAGDQTPTTLSRSASGTTLPGLADERRGRAGGAGGSGDCAGHAASDRVAALRGAPRQASPARPPEKSSASPMSPISPMSPMSPASPLSPSKAAKLAHLAGLAPHVARVSSFHAGRSHIQQILRQTVAETRAEAAGVALAVCGPPALAVDARLAVCRVNTARSVLQGQSAVTFYSGNFGF